MPSTKSEDKTSRKGLWSLQRHRRAFREGAHEFLDDVPGGEASAAHK